MLIAVAHDKGATIRNWRQIGVAFPLAVTIVRFAILSVKIERDYNKDYRLYRLARNNRESFKLLVGIFSSLALLDNSPAQIDKEKLPNSSILY